MKIKKMITMLKLFYGRHLILPSAVESVSPSSVVKSTMALAGSAVPVASVVSTVAEITTSISELGEADSTMIPESPDSRSVVTCDAKSVADAAVSQRLWNQI